MNKSNWLPVAAIRSKKKNIARAMNCKLELYDAVIFHALSMIFHSRKNGMKYSGQKADILYEKY